MKVIQVNRMNQCYQINKLTKIFFLTLKNFGYMS